MGVPKSYGFQFGYLEPGPRNLITDVPGVTVGHVTIHDGEIHTGVTALLPHGGDVFHDKCVAAAHVINGFGKSAGVLQVQELGTLETPILLTNTLSVGTVSTALVKYMLERNEDIGVTTGTVNPVVMECNDGVLNDIRGLHVTEEHAFRALASTAEDFEEGDVGAGSGMSCYKFKGGIGSSSRTFELYGKTYTMGALLLTNFGTKKDLVIAGNAVGRRIYNDELAAETEKGSVIVILATDAPLSARQMLRACKRAQSGLARTGSLASNGSGEIVMGFTTANRRPHYKGEEPVAQLSLHEDHMDLVFRAVIESVEESVVSSMVHAKTVVGRAGNTFETINNYL